VSGTLISPELRARVKGLMTPIAIGLGRLGLTPNALTVIGFVIACIAAVAAGLQAWLAAGLLVIFGGVFDLFDGALARATNRVSKAGAFLDSTFDRWGEGVVYIGISYQDKADAAKAFLSQYSIAYPAAPDDATGSIAIAYGVTGPPETAFIDRNGVVASKVGGALDDGTLERDVQLIIKSASK
jgi:archaetidylinositol phosphate synthase